MSAALRQPFQANGLWFRPLAQEDLATTLSWRLQERVRSQFHDSSTLDATAHANWFANVYSPRVDSECIWLFGDADSGPVGQVSLYRCHEPRLTATFGRLVVGDAMKLGRGYGRRATEAVTQRAFALGFVRVLLDVKETNSAALAVYNRVGYRRIGIVAAEPGVVHMAALPAHGTVHTVIVGSYNRKRYIRQALESVVTQYGPNWQMIVSDDGSDEETLATIRLVTDRDPRCTLLVCEERPPVAVRGPTAHVRAVQRINDALPHAYGDIVHYLPDDDYFAPNRFMSFEALFQDASRIIGYGRLRYVDRDGAPGEDRFPGTPVNDPHCLLDHSQVAHRRRVFDTVKRWPTEAIDYASDGVFYRALVRAGYGPIWPIDRLVSFKRMHPFNMLTTQSGSGERRE